MRETHKQERLWNAKSCDGPAQEDSIQKTGQKNSVNSKQSKNSQKVSADHVYLGQVNWMKSQSIVQTITKIVGLLWMETVLKAEDSSW